MKGEKGAIVHDYFAGYQAFGTMMSIRKDNWKLAVPSPKTWSIEALDTWQLFNLDSDLDEKNDLSAKFPEKIIELKELAKRVDEAIKTNKPLPLK